jgi:N utilization substance protein A
MSGEKIDIVEFSDDPIAFVTNALSPAKVQRVSVVDDGERVMEVIVEDKQLSLAIGKKGQNVRLAAKLTGWRIDIKSEEEKRREVEAQFGELETPGAAHGDESAEVGQGGAVSADAADAGNADADNDAIAEAPASDVPVPYTLAGIGEKTVRKLVEGGYPTLESLTGVTADALAELPGIGGKTAEKILAAARGDAPAEEEAQE